MWVHLTVKSKNEKTGEIPVSTTEKASCPAECSLKDGPCYARGGPLGIHWAAVSNYSRGDNFTAFCNRVRKFVADQLWRHNQAGDLPQRKDGKINRSKCRQLSAASRHTRGWTYTHYNPNDPHNQATIKEMNSQDGMTVNLSSNNLTQADEYVKLNIGPVVTLLPENAPDRGNKTPAGLPIVVCPAQLRDEITCERCKLCQVRNRKSIVGFKAHGASKRKLSAILEGG